MQARLDEGSGLGSRVSEHTYRIRLVSIPLSEATMSNRSKRKTGQVGSRVFRKITQYMWGDPRFRRLSRPGPSAQYLYQYLQTGPETQPLSGVISMHGSAALAESLGWTSDEVRSAFAEIEVQGLGKADWEARLIFLPTVMSENPPENPNVITSWMRQINELPGCNLKKEIMNFVVNNGWFNRSGDGYPNGYPNGIRNQEQEQEQEK